MVEAMLSDLTGLARFLVTFLNLTCLTSGSLFATERGKKFVDLAELIERSIFGENTGLSPHDETQYVPL